MKYSKTLLLKNGMECNLRNGTESDAQAVLDQFHLTHGEKDPKGFLSRVSGFQEVISMRKEKKKTMLSGSDREQKQERDWNEISPYFGFTYRQANQRVSHD